jgi:hypothetical protein
MSLLIGEVEAPEAVVPRAAAIVGHGLCDDAQAAFAELLQDLDVGEPLSDHDQSPKVGMWMSWESMRLPEWPALGGSRSRSAWYRTARLDVPHARTRPHGHRCHSTVAHLGAWCSRSSMPDLTLLGPARLRGTDLTRSSTTAGAAKTVTTSIPVKAVGGIQNDVTTANPMNQTGTIIDRSVVNTSAHQTPARFTVRPDPRHCYESSQWCRVPISNGSHRTSTRRMALAPGL